MMIVLIIDQFFRLTYSRQEIFFEKKKSKKKKKIDENVRFFGENTALSFYKLKSLSPPDSNEIRYLTWEEFFFKAWGVEPYFSRHFFDSFLLNEKVMKFFLWFLFRKERSVFKISKSGEKSTLTFTFCQISRLLLFLWLKLFGIFFQLFWLIRSFWKT